MPAGRPRKEVDAEGVFKLARIGCTNAEIGDYFGCDGTTISRNFADELALGRADMHYSLRRWQFKRAKAGSDTMLIHLGKQYIGQSDRTEVKNTGQASVVIMPHDGRNPLPKPEPDDPT